MENEKIKIGIAEIQNIKMITEEKERILKNVLNFPIPPQKPIQSPYSFISMFQKNHLFRHGMVFCLIVFLSGGGVVFGSQKSLPGNILYPLKVNIFEPIISTMKFSLEEKAQYESSLATARLIEAETLTSQGKLDASTEKQLNDLLITHTTNLNITINELRQDQSDEKARNIVTSFQAEMNAHAQVLDIINEKVNTKKENQNIQISQTARANADNIKNSFENNTGEIMNEYEKNKYFVESLIDSTISDINQINTDTSPIKQRIIEDARKTLDQSKQFLDEANAQNNIGDSKSEYSAMLNSESSAKEASILLKTGLQLEENKK